MTPHPRHPAWIDLEKLRPPHAKIVATLGPASDSPEMVRRLIDVGVSVFRLNFSHGEFDQHKARLDRVREAAKKADRPIAVLGDLQGPKIRVGEVPDLSEGGGIVVETGQDVRFKRGQGEAAIIDDVPTFDTTFTPIFHDVEPGQRVLINDGAIRMLAVHRVDGEELICRVTYGGRVTSRKGINLPESDLKSPAITDRDWRCVEWAVNHHLDYLALSFVRTAHEVLELKRRLEGMCSVEKVDDPNLADGQPYGIPVISKIEKPQALENIEAIVEASDAVMVARGDLGVEMDTAQVPVAQKYIIATCREYGRPCIVATQMLESMIDSISPTRAEASDVANAIFDGADAVMLSGETAVGAHPDVVVETMQRIVQVAEVRIDQMEHEPSAPSKMEEYPYRSAALAYGAWHVADRCRAKAVAVWSQQGGMATYLSQNDFRQPILAYTHSPIAARRMALLGGVTPIEWHGPPPEMLADWTDAVEEHLLHMGMAEDGDAVVLVAGKPLGSKDAQNALAIMRVGDPLSGFRPR